MAVAATLALLAAARPARAEVAEAASRAGQACADGPGARLVWHHLLVFQYNPLGLEQVGRLGLCVPFIDRPGLLFDRTSFEVGVVEQLAPAYGHLGGYAQLTPLSFLTVRVEMTGLGMWAFPVDRGGYFARTGYDDDFQPEILTYDVAGSAGGWNLNLVAQLQARVSLGPVALIVLDAFSYERWVVGRAPYYVNPRRELILAGDDQLLANEAMLMVEIPLPASVNLRVGAYDALRYGLGGEQLSNAAGLLVMAHWAELDGGRVRNLTPFVRVGLYSDHPFRVLDVHLMAGLLVTFDLATLPGGE